LKKFANISSSGMSFSKRKMDSIRETEAVASNPHKALSLTRESKSSKALLETIQNYIII